MTNNKDEQANINVTSNYQSGGITAHTVNVNPTYQRILGDVIRQKLLQTVPTDKLVVVWFTHGNDESFKYASEIFQFMKNAGFNLFGNGPTAQIFLAPLNGVRVVMDDKTEISIGLISASEIAEARGLTR